MVGNEFEWRGRATIDKSKNYVRIWMIKIDWESSKKNQQNLEAYW